MNDLELEIAAGGEELEGKVAPDNWWDFGDNGETVIPL